MNEDKRKSYLLLILKLVLSSDGVEKILQANLELVDKLVDDSLSKNVNNLAKQCLSLLFFIKVFRAVTRNQSFPQYVAPSFQANIDKLDSLYDICNTLRPVLQVWAKENLKQSDLEQAGYFAGVEEFEEDIAVKWIAKEISNFSNIVRGIEGVVFGESPLSKAFSFLTMYSPHVFSLTDKPHNLKATVVTYKVLQIYTEYALPQQWAKTQNNLGNAYSDRIRGDRKQNLEIAIAVYQKALQIYTKSDFPQQWAKTQNNLGNAYYERIKGNRKQNLETAIVAYQKALQIYTEYDFPQQWAKTQNNLGNAYSDRIRGDRADNLETAIVAYQSALRVYTQEKLHFTCLKIAKNLGNCAFKNQNWKQAIQAYKQAIQAVEITRTWALDDNRRQEIISEGIQVYRNLVVAAINNKQFNLAIETVERSRSLGLVDLMESSKVGSSGEISPELQRYLQDYELLQQRINALRMPQPSSLGQGLITARDSGNAKIAEADLQAIRELEAQKQQIWQNMRRLDPILAGQKQVDPLNLSQMQSLIDDEVTALLSFYTTDNDTYIFILKTGQSPHFYTCEGQGLKALQGWISENWHKSYVEDRYQWFAKMEDFLTQLSQSLQIDDLIAQHLTEIEELIIVPHLGLHQIPFAALPIDFSKEEGIREKGGEDLIKDFVSVASKNSKDNRGIVIKPQPKPTKPTSQPSQYLSDRFRLRVVPSCQILHYCHQRPTIDSQIMGIVEDATEDLVYTGYECETIAQQYQIPANLRLRGNQATTSNYRYLSQQVNILHSSHHAASDISNPLESQLQLADGFLTLGQLFSPGWRMPNLNDVFASCCEVNFTVTEITDDMFTLATGFLCAGARNVVSTLWSVDDFATALLAIFYYDFRSQGLTRPQSLQKAQQKLRNLTGKELEEKYHTQLHNHLQQRQATINQALETAKTEGDEEKVEKLQNLAEKIVIQKENTLPHHCEQEYPFASPFYWAGFVSQGLA